MQLILFLLFVGYSKQHTTAIYYPPELTTASPCPSGFKLVQGSCISEFHYTIAERNKAYNLCAKKSSYLPDVRNAFENAQLLTLGAPTDNIWLGLTCTSNEITSCVWDATGIAVTLNSYTNFAPGGLNISAGPCVYLSFMHGWWYSDNCGINTRYVACKYNPGIEVKMCDDSSPFISSEVFTFRNRCYWQNNNANFQTHSNACAQGCGRIVSIHSPGENSFIQGFGQLGSYSFIGLNDTQRGAYWLDGSDLDYKNFGNKNQIDVCVYMSIFGEMGNANPGQWLDTNCGFVASAICTKDLINDCDPQSATTISAATFSPRICSSPTSYTQNGTIYSPGYPEPSGVGNCEYIITVNKGQKAQIFFPEISLLLDSTLYFYSDPNASKPFKKLSYMFLYPETVYSPTNYIRMKYKSTGDGSKWIGNYGPIPSCMATYTGSGTFTSQNYPSGYLTNTTINCTTIIQSAESDSIVCITFDDIDIRLGDKIHIYSGQAYGREIATLTSADHKSNQYCSLELEGIQIVFEIHQFNGYPGRGYRGQYYGYMKGGYTESFTTGQPYQTQPYTL